MARFQPGPFGSVTLTSGTTAVSAGIDGTAPLVGVVAAGNSTVFLKFSRSDAPQSATVTDIPIAPGAMIVLAKPVGYDVVSAISPAGGTDTVYVMTGTDVY